MVGDRRATSGNLISNHRIEKVFPADSHSGVAVAGVAGPAAEMVRLFQLQLEHYEKVEGTPLSLDGKANQLGQMVGSNLPAAIHGLAVLPIFAGFDLAAGVGRIFEYDITGGRYEESDYAAIGSGFVHAQTVLKLGFRAFQTGDDAIDLALEALFVAADSDAATGGPDLERGIFPVVAEIGADGYRRIGDDDLRDRVGRLADPGNAIAAARGDCRDHALLRAQRGAAAVTMPYYVPPEQMMKDRADYARKGIARGRSLVAFSCDDGVVIVAENNSRTLRKVSEIYDRIAFAGWGSTTSSISCA